MKHTPWKTKPDGSPAIVDARGHPVALVKLCADPDEFRAIRDLIAAAPALLAACCAAWEELTYGNGDVDFIRSQLKNAIVKAKGNVHETDSDRPDAGPVADPPAD